MVIKGVFGYIIGKKKRYIHVEDDADLLWKILVREIFILMKHYGTKEALKEAFEKIKVTKNNPTSANIKKCKIFSEQIEPNNNVINWPSLLHYCQSSFINILEAGYIVNQSDTYGFIFLLDFNKYIAYYTHKNYKDEIKQINTASIDEIMEFEWMPTKTYTEIVTEMKTDFNTYNEKIAVVQTEIEKLTKLKQNVANQGAVNIEDKLNKLLDDMKWEEKKINMERRVFYRRLKELDLIDE